MVRVRPDFTTIPMASRWPPGAGVLDDVLGLAAVSQDAVGDVQETRWHLEEADDGALQRSVVTAVAVYAPHRSRHVPSRSGLDTRLPGSRDR
jgi:hypothetical protein